MNFRSWQRWRLIEYAVLREILIQNGRTNEKVLLQTKSEVAINHFFHATSQFPVLLSNPDKRIPVASARSKIVLYFPNITPPSALC